MICSTVAAPFVASGTIDTPTFRAGAISVIVRGDGFSSAHPDIAADAQAGYRSCEGRALRVGRFRCEAVGATIADAPIAEPN
jgi:hypothetical protein